MALLDHISLQPKTSWTDSLTQSAAGKSRLPQDLLEDASRRLQFACLFILVVSVVGTVVRGVTGMDQELSWLMRYGTLIVVWVVTVGVYAIARAHLLSPSRILDLAMAYQVFIALDASLLISSDLWSASSEVIAWPPVAVWILIYPMIVPNTTGKTLLAALLSAVSEPVAVLFYVNAGLLAPPTVAVWVQRLWPSAVAVVSAVVISRMIYHMGAKLRAARQMGSYQLVDRLGEGGMGEVWKATHRMLARSAAIKLILPDRLKADGVNVGTMLKRFEREAQATAALRSPHTIELYDFGIARDGTFYYVMELLDGVDLDTLVAKHGVQTPARTIFLLRQACHSLQEAHAGGLIHRDIKPANLFMCRYGTDLDFVKVLDFGLVKESRPSNLDKGLTHVGAIAGTPAFMPPEMALGDGPVDGRADIYALGCVAYWLLTGRLVFEGDSAMGMLVSHARDEPEPASTYARERIAPQFDDLILACLAKDPVDRPQTAFALRQGLDAVELDHEWTAEQANEWWSTHRPPAAPKAATESGTTEVRDLEVVS